MSPSVTLLKAILVAAILATSPLVRHSLVDAAEWAIQNGYSYSGTTSSTTIDLEGTTMVKTTWSVPTDKRGCSMGALTGNYVWMTPWSGVNFVLRVHKTSGAMTKFSGFPSGVNLGSTTHFSGALYDSVRSRVWMVPLYANKVSYISTSTGSIGYCSGWPSGVTSSVGASKFYGGVITQPTSSLATMWMAPGKASHLVSVRLSSCTLSKHGNWPSGFVGGTFMFEGIVRNNRWGSGGAPGGGDRMFMCPKMGSHVVKVQTNSPAYMWGYNAWPSGWSSGARKFSGATHDGTDTWCMPKHANMIVRVKEFGTMHGYKNWPAGFTLGAFNGGAIFDGRYIWCLPGGASHIIRIEKSTGALFAFPKVSGQVTLDPSNGGALLVTSGNSVWRLTFVTPCTTTANCNGNHANSATGNVPNCNCNCKNNYDGSTCNVCAATYGPTYPTCNAACTNAGDCNNHGTASGYAGSCSCSCATEYSGSTCNTCASGYETYSFCYRICTNNDDCNGNAAAFSGNLGPGGCSCTCKPNFAGPSCGSCADGFARFPTCATITESLSESKKTITSSPSDSSTVTQSKSQTLSRSFTSTPSASRSPSSSSTESCTISPTPSASHSLSASSTWSHSHSTSATWSSSTSSSLTATPTESDTPSLTQSQTKSLTTTRSRSVSASKTECAVFGPPRQRSVDFLMRDIDVLNHGNAAGTAPGPLVAQVNSLFAPSGDNATTNLTTRTSATRADSIPVMTGSEFTNRRFQFTGTLVLSIHFNQPLRRDVNIQDFVFAQELPGSRVVTGNWDATPSARNYTVHSVQIKDVLPLSEDPFHTIELSIPYREPSTWMGDSRIISVFVHRSAFRCEEFWIPADQRMGFNISVVVQHDPYAPLIDPSVQSIFETLSIVTSTLSAGLGHPAQALILARMSTLNSLAFCYFSHNHSLPAMTSPTDQKLGPTHGQYYRGGIVGNLLLLVVLSAVSAGTTIAIFVRALLKPQADEERIRTRKELWMAACGKVHMPSVLIIPICLCYQGTVSISTTLFIHTTDLQDNLLAVVGALVCFLTLLGIGLCSTIFFRMTLKPRKTPSPDADEETPEGDTNADPPPRKSLWQWICSLLDSKDHWVRDAENHPHWKAQFYLFFHDYSYAAFFLFEIGLCFVTGIIDGVRVTDWITCVSLVALMAGLFLGTIVLVAVLKPSLTQFQQGFLLVMNGLSFIASVCLLVGMLTKTPWAVQAAGIIGFLMLIFGTLKFIMDLYGAAMWAWSKVRNKDDGPKHNNHQLLGGLSLALLAENHTGIVMATHEDAAALRRPPGEDDEVSLELPEFEYHPPEEEDEVLQQQLVREEGEVVLVAEAAGDAEELELPEFEYNPSLAEVDEDEREQESEATWWARQQRIREAREAEVEEERRRGSADLGLAGLGRNLRGSLGRENAFGGHTRQRQAPSGQADLSTKEQEELDAFLDSLEQQSPKVQRGGSSSLGVSPVPKPEVTQADLDRLDEALGNTASPPPVVPLRTEMSKKRKEECETAIVDGEYEWEDEEEDEQQHESEQDDDVPPDSPLHALEEAGDAEEEEEQESDDGNNPTQSGIEEDNEVGEEEDLLGDYVGAAQGQEDEEELLDQDLLHLEV